MTRIVAGLAGGRRIAVPAGRGTRPTSERAREALFASLTGLLELNGARVLDLYAGSGAVGLEARSRGAAAVTLVESDGAADAVIRDNRRALGFDGVEVVRDRVERFVRRPPVGPPYDLVFADPPYSVTDAELAGCIEAVVARWLARGAVLVVERPARAGTWMWPAGVEPLQARRYGRSGLWYGRRS